MSNTERESQTVIASSGLPAPDVIHADGDNCGESAHKPNKSLMTVADLALTATTTEARVGMQQAVTLLEAQHG